MVDLDGFTYEEHPPRTKAQLDVEVSALTYDRRLSMAARRAADVFDYCSMFSTASLLRRLARGRLQGERGVRFMEAETE